LCSFAEQYNPFKVKIENNRVVSIHYTLRDGDGVTLDSSAGRSPLPYIHGIGALIPGLEKELLGKQQGDTLSVIIPPAEGYGEYEEERVFAVPLGEFDMDEPLEQGMQIQLDTEGGPVIATIVKIDDENVTLDLNHPLAGVPLHFDVEVMEVREASAQELAHGHVHGPGGHHH
jgi:FKBP-type peptidyl-prolyl cis-trans isomerase SlyD